MSPKNTFDADAMTDAPPTNPRQPNGLTIAVVVATTGRPRTSRLTIDRLARQSKAPNRVLAVAVVPGDIAELGQSAVAVESYFAPRGLCAQRNHGLSLLCGQSDLIVFFDDDFLPADDFLENAERLFLENPEIVGATGRVIADGANGRGIPFEEAEALLAADSLVAHGKRIRRPKRGLYGCNMVYRAAAIGELKFDEDLPLYGWQEDVDFSYRLGSRGRLVACETLRGVHMGEKIGRTSGRRLGYSQIANPVYLLGKRSIPRDLGWRLMRNNVASNLVGSLWPERYIDRRGRLVGNLLALRDLATRRLHPRRILELG